MVLLAASRMKTISSFVSLLSDISSQKDCEDRPPSDAVVSAVKANSDRKMIECLVSGTFKVDGKPRRTLHAYALSLTLYPPKLTSPLRLPTSL